jgi:hypothetical protein
VLYPYARRDWFRVGKRSKPKTFGNLVASQAHCTGHFLPAGSRGPVIYGQRSFKILATGTLTGGPA